MICIRLLPRKNVNTHVNAILSRLREKIEEQYRWWITEDSYLAFDETVGDVFVEEDGKYHLRTRYFWGLRTSITHRLYTAYAQGKVFTQRVETAGYNL